MIASSIMLWLLTLLFTSVTGYMSDRPEKYSVNAAIIAAFMAVGFLISAVGFSIAAFLEIWP